MALASSWQLLGGDCRQVLAKLDEASVDACITDPPYEIGFMGKAWDRSGVAFDPDTWRAVLRVLKPGAHLLAFGGTRTVHRIACAIEDAGFDIRDQLSWLYGSGFPKSLDVSKAIDAAAGAVREVVGPNPNHRAVSGIDYAGVYAGGNTGSAAITVPCTDAAREWDGWGTALKPACEPIVLARKPLAGTVAANVLTHGTGALNIDACRIATAETLRLGKTGLASEKFFTKGVASQVDKHQHEAGRWPANVLLDEEAAALLDEQAGERTSNSMRAGTKAGRKSAVYNGDLGRPLAADIVGSSGGASRFFYVAKAARRERDAGLDHLPARSGGEATVREDGSAGLNSPRAGAGRRGGARNFHPTVKPIELMRYLVRLVTPPGGLVLDPFAGSGTTGIAALREGMRFVGVDLEPEYARIAIARIEEDAPLFNRRRG